MSVQGVRGVDMVAAEWMKLFRRPPLWVLLVLEIGLLLVVAVAVRTMPVEAGGTRPSTLELAVPIGMVVGQVFAALAGAALAQEYGWRTLPLTLSRGAPRLRWLGLRFVAQAPALLLVAAVPLVVGLGLSVGNLAEALAASHMRLESLWLVALAAAAGMLPYLALGYLLAVATRAIAPTVGGVLVIALLLEQLLGQLVAGVGPYLPSSLASALLAGSGVGRAWAAVGIAVYVLTFLVVAGAVFRRQDLGG